MPHVFGARGMSNSKLPREEREHLKYLRDTHFRDQNGRCYFCDVKMTPADVPDPKPGTTVTIEHIKPRQRGGGSNFINTAASCLDCNNKRSRQAYVKGKDIPKVKVGVRMMTAAYVATAEPDVLVLFNIRKMRRDDTLLAIRREAGGSFDLKGLCDV